MRVYWIVSAAAAAGLSSVWFNESLASLAQGSKTGSSDAPSTGLAVNGRLSVGDSGLLTNGSLANAYPFELTSATRVTFDLQSSDVDTYLYLFDAEGNLVDENDDRSEDDFNALLQVSLEPGRYVVLSSSYAVLEQGGYVLEARGVALTDAVPLTEVAFAPTEELRLLDVDVAIARLQEPRNGPWRSVLQVYRGGATGSATVLNAGGLLLTNYHVIEDEAGDEPPVYVGIALDVDRPVTPLFEATIERTSADDDLALLQIRSTLLGGNLPNNLAFAPLQLGDVNALSLGDPVTVLGFPGTTAIQGQGASYLTLTQGVVSAMISRFSKRYDLISDVAVNSGNSGGAALNSKGELVAIPTGTVSESRGGDLDSASVLRTVEAIPSDWFGLINP